jgi:Domain of unknown function (DUF3516)/DEAD/DEAH box helicase
MEGPLGRLLPVREGDAPSSVDETLDAFLQYLKVAGLTLYPAQEEAILEIYAGSNVILNTPTGSGKSLVALAMHFLALSQCKRAYYTSPIKALASEKFFSLSRDLSPDWVGMATGDATVNREAFIVCSTAEILANIALAEGKHAPVDYVVMDEFHYYSDKERGTAWQVPLLTMPHAQFLLMSATLGPTDFFKEELTRLTGRKTVVVKSADRPVPLDYTYLDSPLQESLSSLLGRAMSPIYLVNFTQREASEQAQNLMSVDVTTKEEKKKIALALQGVGMESPFGKVLSRFIRHGIGVHHAGLLPKYRLLVEKLAGEGLLKIISGTDTLGVGVNIPIRSVLFTKMCKYDGERTRIMSAREFHQMAGRAGRRGYDNQGSVFAQAPEHVIENLRLEAKAGGDPVKKKRIVRKKPPEWGYVPWDKAVFDKLVSRFEVSQGMVLDMMLRQEQGGCLGLGRLIRRSHEKPARKRILGKTAQSMVRSLLEQGVVVRSPEGGYQLREGLQRDFSMNHALSLFLFDAVHALDQEAPTFAMDLVSVVEATLESPRVILEKQLDVLKRNALTELKQAGVPYEERMEALEKIENEKPMAPFLYDTFEVFRIAHPWAAGENVRPKKILREMLENLSTFSDYIKDLGLERSEGILLRYLTDAYRTLAQGVPDQVKTNEVREIETLLSAIIRSVDSSLLAEWEKIKEGSPKPEDGPRKEAELPSAWLSDAEFRVLLRNTLFAFVRAVARGDLASASELLRGSKSEHEVGKLFAAFVSERGSPRVGPEARATDLFNWDAPDPTQAETKGLVRGSYTLLDGEDQRDHALFFEAERDPVFGLSLRVHEVRS